MLHKVILFRPYLTLLQQCYDKINSTTHFKTQPLKKGGSLIPPPNIFPTEKRQRPPEMIRSWKNVPYRETLERSLQHDHRVRIPMDLIRDRDVAKRVARKYKKTIPIPVTRKVKISPMLSEDTDWYIYPNKEFFDVCDRETVLSWGGARLLALLRKEVPATHFLSMPTT